ncbi:MAG TPA: methyltransferase domain-containing protein [Streptomyces sp.]|uniref:class I SAM-dependent methyltransferase n=1 Tax=Streptomyces sp. TaxID=1931 RepID=UPI002D703CDC|nr:methyltransferase domain-containing protein [Streptomyces sp.]HZG04667.1 methyltransferase domain-containing protein [Streptomyces sp.]
MSSNPADHHRTTLMDAAYSDVYGAMYRRHWWWRAREHQVLALIRRHVEKGDGPGKVLDVGCGDGLIWDSLTGFAHIEGIEPDSRLIHPASPRRDRIEIADFLRGRPRPADHDLLLMLDVLEHIEDEHAALLRAKALLAPRGILLLTVPALPALWSEFDEMSGHFRRYTRRSLRRALTAAGLEIIDLRYSYFWTVPPLFVRRLLFRAAAGEQSLFLRPPPAPINSALHMVSRLDHALSRRIPLPVGSSLVAVAGTRPVPRGRQGAVRSR